MSEMGAEYTGSIEQADIVKHTILASVYVDDNDVVHATFHQDLDEDELAQVVRGFITAAAYQSKLIASRKVGAS